MPTFWSRQLTFLRRRWWNHHPLTAMERAFSFLRGLVLIAVAVFGMVVVSTNTLGLSSRGMDAVSKLLAEFLLIPVAILGFIMAAYGVSQIARSVIPNHLVVPLPDPDSSLDPSTLTDPDELASEEFQLREEEDK